MFNDALMCAKRLSTSERVMSFVKQGITSYQYSSPTVITLGSKSVAKIDNSMLSVFVIVLLY